VKKPLAGRRNSGRSFARVRFSGVERCRLTTLRQPVANERQRLGEQADLGGGREPATGGQLGNPAIRPCGIVTGAVARATAPHGGAAWRRPAGLRAARSSAWRFRQPAAASTIAVWPPGCKALFQEGGQDRGFLGPVRAAAVGALHGAVAAAGAGPVRRPPCLDPTVRFAVAARRPPGGDGASGRVVIPARRGPGVLSRGRPHHRLELGSQSLYATAGVRDSERRQRLPPRTAGTTASGRFAGSLTFAMRCGPAATRRRRLPAGSSPQPGRLGRGRPAGGPIEPQRKLGRYKSDVERSLAGEGVGKGPTHATPSPSCRPTAAIPWEAAGRPQRKWPAESGPASAHV